MGMRRFNLVRSKDFSGVSGTGRIAEGCEMSNGRIFVQWLTPIQSVEQCDNVKAYMAIHGHGGATRVEWVDPEDPIIHVDPVRAVPVDPETAKVFQHPAK